MFANLREVLKRKGVSIRAYAELLGVNETSVQNKLQGRTEFSLSEFRKTCNLFPEYNEAYLFQTTDDVA